MFQNKTNNTILITIKNLTRECHSNIKINIVFLLTNSYSNTSNFIKKLGKHITKPIYSKNIDIIKPFTNLLKP